MKKETEQRKEKRREDRLKLHQREGEKKVEDE